MLQKITRSLLRNSRTFRMMPSLATRIHYKFSEDSHPDFQATKKAPISESTIKEKQDEIDKVYLREKKQIVKGNKVVLFMKGTPAAPMCGYSNYAVQVLQFYKVNEYHSVDVLADAVIREEVKKYSNWPTFP